MKLKVHVLVECYNLMFICKVCGEMDDDGAPVLDASSTEHVKEEQYHEEQYGEQGGEDYQHQQAFQPHPSRVPGGRGPPGPPPGPPPGGAPQQRFQQRPSPQQQQNVGQKRPVEQVILLGDQMRLFAKFLWLSTFNVN